MAHAGVLGCKAGSPGGTPSLTSDTGTRCLSAGSSSFTGVQSYYYWSSSARENPLLGPGIAWVPNLNAAEMSWDYKGGSEFVWPVRGGR